MKTLSDIRCATNAEKREWAKFWAAMPRKHRQVNIVDTWCGDCTVKYAAEMRAEGRCIRRSDFNPEKRMQVVEAYDWR